VPERRRFSGRERAALYLAADGRCSWCGGELLPGWHADHEVPWSRGGPTDVVNGQALCPDCNLSKGDHVSSLRPWQERALRRFISSSQRDFLVEATPGAGKTTLALTAARTLLDEGQVARVIVVCPTSHLRRQWADAANALGIPLDPGFVNKNAGLSPDYLGAVVTYASMVTGSLIVRRLCSVPTLIVLDEVHHCSEEDRSAWGRAIGEAFADVGYRRLLLSGTPFREDGRPIPFVRYENGVAVADYRYLYPEALRDGVCRPVEFLAFDGEMQWREVSGRTITSLLSVANNEKDERRAFRSALLADGAWMPDVLAAADRHLTQVREEMPDAGGLVIANTREQARAYALLLQGITGQEATVVVSRDNGEDLDNGLDPSAEIKRFAAAPSRRWLVAVRMVSEGVDIPRLAVGVYATSTWTEMFFRQAIGRFIRVRGELEPAAAVFVPSVGTLLTLAARIADEIDLTLREESERSYDSDGTEQGELPLSEPLGSGAATEYGRIADGEAFDLAEIERARTFRQTRPEYRSVSETTLALILRDMGGRRPAGETSDPFDIEALRASPPTPAPISVEQQLRSLRNRVKRAVNRYCHRTQEEQGVVHGKLNRTCGDRVPTASIATLNKRLGLLREWGEEV
jgi:superfamily II DNA or RNA helicase